MFTLLRTNVRRSNAKEEKRILLYSFILPRRSLRANSFPVFYECPLSEVSASKSGLIINDCAVDIG